MQSNDTINQVMLDKQCIEHINKRLVAEIPAQQQYLQVYHDQHSSDGRD